MRNSALCLSPLTLYFFFFSCLDISHAQSTTANHTCQANQSTYPCQTFAFYRAMAPDFLDLASIGDLFSVSRVMIANPSNISSPSAPLIQNQRLLIPITCSCNPINSTYSMSFANLTYTIKKGDTFYLVSTQNYQNLTTYPYVEIVNPDLVPTSLIVGVNVVFPIFCSCPSKTQANYLISYVLHPSDNLSSIASQFNTTEESITDVNGNSLQPYETIFIPASQLPQLSQPNATAASPAASRVASSRKAEPKGKVMGLSVGLGLCGLLLILVVALWGFREGSVKRGREERGYEKQESLVMGKGGGAGKGKGGMEVNLMANVSDCLDKYRVFKIEELKRATGDFDDACLIQGSVYKGSIDGEIYAIKKMKWNAYEELKILQKVNHGNLVKLEGFCINPENANCYLIYEYLQNGSLHWWLHENRSEKLNWRTRLRIAIDVANGLQYIHEHTRPRVVHKDIKSSNILLDSTMRAKIANFGLAKTGFNAITTHIVGTQGYVAPEYISDGVVSTKMDVFSFGVVLLELITGKEAIDEDGKMLWLGAGKVLEGGEKKNEEKVKRWMDEALDGESCSMDGVMNVMNIAVACVNRDSSKRPSMVDIVYALCKSDDLFVDFSEDGLSANSIQAR